MLRRSVELDESWFEVNGLSHHVLRWSVEPSKEPRVVLCHGFLDAAATWQDVAARLASRRRRVYAFDWRGHGRTDWIAPGASYFFLDYLRDLDALLPKLSEEPVHLVGHSMGGAACAMFAAVRPERVASLTVVEGLGPPTQAIASAPRRTRRWLDFAHGRPSTPFSVAEGHRRLRAAHPYLTDRQVHDLSAKLVVPCAVKKDAVTWQFDPRHRAPTPTPFLREMFSAYLESVSAPSLVVQAECGLHLDDFEERVGRLARVERATIKGVGHMIHWVAPFELVALLERFFSKVDRPSK